MGSIDRFLQQGGSRKQKVGDLQPFIFLGCGGEELREGSLSHYLARAGAGPNTLFVSLRREKGKCP